MDFEASAIFTHAHVKLGHCQRRMCNVAHLGLWHSYQGRPGGCIHLPCLTRKKIGVTVVVAVAWCLFSFVGFASLLLVRMSP